MGEVQKQRIKADAILTCLAVDGPISGSWVLGNMLEFKLRTVSPQSEARKNKVGSLFIILCVYVCMYHQTSPMC